MRRFLAVLTILLAAASALAIGSRGRERTPVGPHASGIIAQYSFSGLTPGATTLPSVFTFSRASSATVQTSASTIVTTVTTDQPRAGTFDGTNFGFLIEESRTNTYPYARDPSNAGLIAGSGVTYTTGQTSPDGTTNAARVQVPTNGYSRYYQAIKTGTFVCSIWLQRGAGTGITQFDYYLSTTGGLIATTAIASWARYTGGTFAWSGTGMTAIVADGRASISGMTAQALDSVVDLIDCQQGSFETQPIITSGGSATRAGERLYVASASTFVRSGRLALEIDVRPEAAPSSYSAAMRFWTRGSDYCEFATTGVLTCSVGGSTNTTAAFSWAANDVVRIFVGVGGSIATAVSYTVNAGAVVRPTVTGSALGNVSTGGALDLLCSGTASQLSAWVTKIVVFGGAAKPTWAANDNGRPAWLAA